MRWPTWHESIEIAKYIKTLVFGKPLYRLATLLISLGVGLTGGGTIGQVGFALFLLWVNQKLGTPLPSQAILDAISTAAPVGIALILGGAILFIYAHSRDEKQKRETRPQFDLVVHPTNVNNWAHFGTDNKYKDNAGFSVAATVELILGGDDLYLTEVEAIYYAHGCCCPSVTSTYFIDDERAPRILGSRLETPHLLQAGTAHFMKFQLTDRCANRVTRLAT